MKGDERIRTAVPAPSTETVYERLSRVEAELARLREERDAAQREADIQLGEKLAAQVTLKAITDSLCLPLAELGDGWTEATRKILARIEEVVDEGERWFQEATRLRSDKDERDWRTLEIVNQRAKSAEALLATTRQALAEISDYCDSCDEGGGLPSTIRLRGIARRALAATEDTA